MRVVLFVHLRDGATLDAALIECIKRQIRDNTTPRHVPAKIVAITDIPHTRSGKFVELAVRNVVHGQPVRNVESLRNPEALEQFAIDRNCRYDSRAGNVAAQWIRSHFSAAHRMRWGHWDPFRRGAVLLVG